MHWMALATSNAKSYTSLQGSLSLKVLPQIQRSSGSAVSLSILWGYLLGGRHTQPFTPNCCAMTAQCLDT